MDTVNIKVNKASYQGLKRQCGTPKEIADEIKSICIRYAITVQNDEAEFVEDMQYGIGMLGQIAEFISAIEDEQ